MRELLVKTTRPDTLDRTLCPLGGGVWQMADGRYVSVGPDIYAVRSLSGNPDVLDFLRFAITRQGYEEVVGEREV